MIIWVIKVVFLPPAQQILELVEFCVAAWNLQGIDFAHIARDMGLLFQNWFGYFFCSTFFSIWFFPLSVTRWLLPLHTTHSCSLVRRKGKGRMANCVSTEHVPLYQQNSCIPRSPSYKMPTLISQPIVWCVVIPSWKKVKEVKCLVRHGHLSKVNLNLSSHSLSPIQ